MNTCALCQNQYKLQKSHVIPDTIFKRLFRQNNGKAITFLNEADSKIGKSSDSWWDYLLCQQCESYLNSNYEKYSLALLRGAYSNINKHSDGITISNADFHKLSLFFISIIWRASVSTHPSYSNVYLPLNFREELRNNIWKDKNVSSRILSIQISRLKDPKKNGFSLDILKNVMLSPFVRSLGSSISFCLIFEGFFMEIFIPGLTHKKRNQKGIIKPNNSILLVPYISIFNIQELVDKMVQAYGKHHENKS